MLRPIKTSAWKNPTLPKRFSKIKGLPFFSQSRPRRLISDSLADRLILFFSAVAILSGLYLLFFINRQGPPTVLIDTSPYVLAEEEGSDLPARMWMNVALEISKKEKLPPPTAARLYAYVASVYSDTLELSGSSDEASLATAKIIQEAYPNFDSLVRSTLGKTGLTLGQPGLDQVVKYKTRLQGDGFQLRWDGLTPANSSWYVRVGQEDPAAASGKWTPWNINLSEIKVPAPPSKNTVHYNLDLTELEFAIKNRLADDEEAIFFWNGVDNFYTLNPTPLPFPGIWQNILYVESKESKNNKTFAKNQKILSQVLADSLIASWSLKYQYLAPRPSMVLPKLQPLLADPPSPAYISDFSAAAAAASDTLGTFFPEKKDTFSKLSQSSAWSRILAGVEFPSAVRSGQAVGSQVAALTISKYFPDAKQNDAQNISDVTSSPLQDILKLIGFLVRSTFQDLSSVISQHLTTPVFTDQAKLVGLDEQSEFGALWSDVDNDGFLDLMTGHGLYRNNGQGKFTKTQTDSSLRAPGAFGDFNNDGCSDFYAVKIGRGGSADSKGEPDLLFRGNCDGSFTDITKESGITDDFHGNSAAWADFDSDGLLDLYVANLGAFPGLDFDTSNPTYRYEPNILYRNNGDSTFSNVTAQAGVEGLLNCSVYKNDPHGLALKVKVSFQPVWFDYNNDRKPDLFVVSDTFMSPLYKNNGDGTFTQVTSQAGLCGPGRDSNMGAAVGDYNNDGYLDVFVNDNGDDYLWQNNKDGTFTNIAKDAGVNEPGYGWGTEALDFDNDGFLDLLVINGNNRIPAKSYFIPNLKHNDLNELFKNGRDGTFEPVGSKSGLRGNDVNFSVGVADYNNDGFPDFFIPTRGERHPSSRSSFYVNRGNPNNWLTVQLVGTFSNRDAVGTRLVLKSSGQEQIREIISGSSYVSQSTPWPTFGLGPSKNVGSLEILWPSGLTQTFKNIPANRKIIIMEGSDQIFNSLTELTVGGKKSPN